MALTDIAVKNLTPKENPYKKYDAHGLYIEVRPTGFKSWRFKFKFNGKSKLLSLGQYPAVSLKEARACRDDARSKLARGIDPALEKQQKRREQSKEQEKTENTFEKIAREWYQANQSNWTPEYADTVIRRLENNLFPWIGNTPISEIEPPLLLEQLRRIEKRGAAETARRVAQLAGSIFRYAIASGLVTRDPAADIKGALKKVPAKHMPALTEPDDIRKLLLSIDNCSLSFIVYCALQFSALTFARPGTVRKATWSEIDFRESLWKIPDTRMKGRKEHLVPLARQTTNILKELRPLTENTMGNFVFPGERMNGRPMSENTVIAALRTLGFPKEKMCAHGFRTMASTRLHESGQWDSRVIEVQLAHTDKNTVRGIYNRAIYLDERRKMMQWWADYLDQLR